MRAHVKIALLGFFAAACESGGEGSQPDIVSTEPGPMMRPGDNCLRCHNSLGPAARRPWTAAGTVFPSLDAPATSGVKDVVVTFTDGQGKVITQLTTNEVGNFYTDIPLVEPYFVSLSYKGEKIAMPCTPPAGSCNACHSPNPVGFAPGRIYVPGAHDTAEPFDCVDWEAGGSGRPSP